METIDDMPIDEAITLYYEKHHAIKQGDMMKLLELKSKCPAIFIEENDVKIRDIIDYAKAFQASDRYKELCRLELKEKLTVIKNGSIEKE